MKKLICDICGKEMRHEVTATDLINYGDYSIRKAFNENMRDVRLSFSIRLNAHSQNKNGQMPEICGDCFLKYVHRILPSAPNKSKKRGKK